MKHSRAILWWCIVVLLPSILPAQTETPVPLSSSALEFVRGFYSWYVPVAAKDHSVPAWELATDERKSFFSPEVVRALRLDSAAQSKAVGVINSLDFDPILASQDPKGRYDVREVTRKGKSYWVDVYDVSSGKANQEPDVMAEVVHRNGRWLFVNFHYPGGKDLLSILKVLRQDRQRHED